MTRLAGPVTLSSPGETDALAARFAAHLGPGDVLLLSGAIGAGKTAFSRALIRAFLGREEDVPSPTFTLVQTYATPGGDEIWHADLYRLSDPAEVVELGLEEAFDTAICLVEWPDRLAELAPDKALTLAFRAHETHHDVTFDGPEDWRSRLEALGV